MAKRERKPPKKPVRMTDLWVQNYKTPGLSPSDTESGIRLHVGASGRKSWIHFYRHPISRKLVKRTLPFMSLAQVRKRVADDKFLLSQGTDPVEEQKAQRQAAINKSEGTLNALAETYLGLCAKKLRSYDLYKRVLQKQVLSRLGEKQVHELRKSDVTAVLDRIESESGPRAADLGGAILRAMLNWHERRSDTFRSPLGRMGMRVDADERVRSRRLDDDEIKRFWAATGDDRVGLFGSVLRLLLLTGGRKSECAEMKHSELATERCKNERGQWVDIVVWKLPASRSKNKDQVIRPLSRNALEIIDSAPRIGDSDYVFSLKGTKPLAMSFQAKKDLLDEIGDLEDWVVHDLRRTFRALLSRCRISLEIKELMLGHAQKQIVKTYDDILEHLPAMQDAAEQVAAGVARIVEGEHKGKVVRLR